MKAETQNLFRVAIVGAATLKGKELKDVLEERNFPAVDIKLLDDDESLGQLAREAGSAIVDLSYALESAPNVPIRAPWIERELGQHTQLTLESSSIELG